LALPNTTFATRRTIDQYFRDQQVAPRVAVESDEEDSLVTIVLGGGLATVAPEGVAASSRQCDCRRPSPSEPFRCCCAATPIAAPPRGPSCGTTMSA
jgi:LysR family transcriptional regulator, cyn operon transcriptional activator